ncbi:MAG: metallophosphoesterase family protein [Clostridia bacterium]|nr:metallophosphoesterase family protein [Clostridia bacterium]
MTPDRTLSLPPLRFKNGAFRIMVVGDLHEQYDLSDELDRLKTADSMRLLWTAAETLRPDLIVYAGDQGKDDDEEKMRAIIRRITAPAKEYGIPYAIVFGNHDPECAIPKARQLELYREEYGNFYTFDGAPGVTGCGNCLVPVKDGAGERDILNLWFADSLNLCEDREVSYYDWLREDQIAWYKDTAKRIKDARGSLPPALWFMHIPVREEYRLLKKARLWEYPFSVKAFGKRRGRYVPRDPSIGYLGEDPACAEVNSGIFDAWKEVGDVRGAFFGHDHMNEFAGEVDGILLAQCKTAGFHNYTDGCNAGVRLITVDEARPEKIETHMVHFKELGLKSGSLGPIQRNFTDRQVINIRIASFAAGAIAVAAGAAALVWRRK